MNPPKSKKLLKIVLLVSIALLLTVAYSVGWTSFLSLETLKAKQTLFENFKLAHPVGARSLYFVIYVAVTAFSIPGAAVATLAGGFLFGLVEGVLLVSFASTLGATLAFLIARFLLRDWIEARYKSKMESMRDGFKRDGAFYLFSLRLVPIFPFFLINLLMSLTTMNALTFFWVSQLGMLPGTIAYVNAGTQLSTISTLSGILSAKIIAAFVALGILPLVSKGVLGWFKTRKIYNKHPRPKKYDYNTVVIGAGSGGLVAAYITAMLRAKVALVEKHLMGGDCLNTGCVPSKALIKSAKVAHLVQNSEEFGIANSTAKISFQQVMERVQKKIATVAPHDSVERYTTLGVDCLAGEAKIESPFAVSVGGKTLTTKNIIVATGARPTIPKILGLEKVEFYTSDTIWKIRECPARLLILGGGPIGCELAQAFSRLGSKVTIVEMGPQIMGREDADVAKFISETFQREGITNLVGHKAEEFKVFPNQKILICTTRDNLEKIEIPFDQVILALGRTANTTGFGLGELGVTITKNHTIQHDAFLRHQFPEYLCMRRRSGPLSVYSRSGPPSLVCLGQLVIRSVYKV